MRALIDSYSSHQRVRGFSEATITRRTWSLKQLDDVGIPVDGHDADTIEHFLARWSTPATRRAVLGDVRAFYAWAVRRGHVANNPTLDVDTPRVPSRAATPVDVSDFHHCLAIANRDARRALMLGAYAGLRCAEIAALDCSDVHPDLGVLVVRDGKGGKDAVIPLAPELAAVLPLTGKAVRYPTAHAVGKAIRRVYVQAGVTARPHDLRALFGTAVARRSNGNMVLTAQLMRHSSIMTTQRYVGWLPDGSTVVAGLHAA